MPSPEYDAILRARDRALFRHLPHGMTCLLLAALLCFAQSPVAAEEQASEYQLKAAFLYNFSRFTSWPDETETQSADFRLCLIGSDPFGDALDALAGKMVRKRPLVIHRASDGPLPGTCQMVFVSPSETGRIRELLAGFRDRPVLTVSDAEDFTLQGGIIQLRLVERKIRFEINVDAANRAGLVISSKLLSLATAVHGKRAGIAP